MCRLICIVLCMAFAQTVVACDGESCTVDERIEHIQKLREANLIVDSVRETELLAKQATLPGDLALWLGNLYEKGQGVDQNPTRAVYWWEQAGALGVAEAMKKLGAAYEYGLGVAKNPEVAASWYYRGSQFGDANSKVRWAGIVLLNTSSNTAKESGEALTTIKNLANSEPDAAVMLGQLYQRGQWVERDQTQAGKLFETAAKGGNAKAAALFGMMQIRGEGTTQDVRSGLQWIARSADEDNESSLIFAKYLETGFYIERNRSLALHYYQKAARVGLAEGMAGEQRIRRYFASPELFGTHIYGVTLSELNDQLKKLGVPMLSQDQNATYWESATLIPGSKVLACRGQDGPVGFLGEMIYRFDPKEMATKKVSEGNILSALEKTYGLSNIQSTALTKPSGATFLDLLKSGSLQQSLRGKVDTPNMLIGRWRIDALEIRLRREPDRTLTLQYRFEPFYSDIVAQKNKSEETDRLRVF